MLLVARLPSNDSLVDVGAIARVVFSSWKMLGLALVCGTFGGVAFGVLARPTFDGVVLAAIDNEAQGGLAAVLGGQIGALASLAGVNVGQAGSRKAEYVALLRSRSFVERFMKREGLLETIHRAQSAGLLGLLRGQRKTSAGPITDGVVINDAIDYFLDSLLSVVEDKKTGLIVVRIQWRDPQQAADWANSFVELFNEEARLRASATARERLKYLEAELARSSTTEVRQSVSRLMESEVNTIMITNVQRDYALRVVDAAVASPVDRPSRPKRIEVAVLGGFAGLAIGVVLVLLRGRKDWWPS